MFASHRGANALQLRKAGYFSSAWSSLDSSRLPSWLHGRRCYPGPGTVAASRGQTSDLVQRPISIKEFKAALDACLTAKDRTSLPQTFGLAVSGGLDSSCMMHLAQGLVHMEHPSRLYRFIALIVDHKARPNSTNEALSVQRLLQSKGVQTKVLHLDWPAGVNPSTLPNFETEARRLRYRALGRECRQSGIRHLLIGQHDDDQAETVLTRIVQGYTGPGLAGISARTRIPECHGMPGVHEIPSGAQRLEDCATEGILVHRPLLAFSKDRLRATCQAEGVRWTEDETNADPTLTTRNAVRHLFKSRELPSALKKESLLKLSNTRQRQAMQMETRGRLLLNRFEFAPLDLRSGRISVCFNEATRNLSPEDPEAVGAFAFAIAEMVRFVSPVDDINLYQMVQLAKMFLRTESMSSPGRGDHEMTTNNFTMSGVQWQKTKRLSRRRQVWSLSRQPHATPKPKPYNLWSRHAIGVHEGDDSMTCSTPFAFWQLFDGRFWIRLLEGGCESLAVRPFAESDMTVIRKRIGLSAAHEKEQFERRLRNAARGKIKWTLPAIVHPSTDLVLALPSMNMRFLVPDLDPARWEIGYKFARMPVLNAQLHTAQHLTEYRFGW